MKKISVFGLTLIVIVGLGSCQRRQSEAAAAPVAETGQAGLESGAEAAQGPSPRETAAVASPAAATNAASSPTEPPTSTVPPAATQSATPLFAEAASRSRYEALLVAGMGLRSDQDFEELDAWALALEKAGDLDSEIDRLSAAADAKNAPPQVSFALSALYGRKGLATRQYAAMVRSEAAAKARPDVLFALTAVYGRKGILKASYSADELLVGALQAESDPPGARFLVDGVGRGTTPSTVDKLLEGKHRIRFELAGFEPWEADFDSVTGETAKVSARLGAKPASLSVATTPAFDVWIDDGSSGPSPRLFEGLAPGRHRVGFSGSLFGNRYYDTAGVETVTLSPGQSAELSKKFVIAAASLRVRNSPLGSSIALDGSRLDASKAFGDGITVEAGRYSARLSAASGQEWSKALVLLPDADASIGPNTMTPILPTRTIKLDGKTDSWGELLPISRGGNFFMGDPRYEITGLYFCKDDKYLYWRVDFKQANPETSIPRGLKDHIIEQLVVMLADRLSLNIGIQYSRANRADSAYATIWDWNGQRGSEIRGADISFRHSPSMLVGRIGLASIKKYATGTKRVYFDVSNEPDASSHSPTVEQVLIFDGN